MNRHHTQLSPNQRSLYWLGYRVRPRSKKDHRFQRPTDHPIPETFLPTSLFGLVAGIAIGLLVAWVYFLIWKVRYTTIIREDADVRFLGGPIDLVVFDGLAEGRVRRIVFLEVKTGRSGLTSRERCVRDVIQAREVEWAELRVTQPFASGAA